MRNAKADSKYNAAQQEKKQRQRQQEREHVNWKILERPLAEPRAGRASRLGDDLRARLS